MPEYQLFGVQAHFYYLQQGFSETIFFSILRPLFLEVATKVPILAGGLTLKAKNYETNFMYQFPV